MSSPPTCLASPDDSDDPFVLCPVCFPLYQECPRCNSTGSVPESTLTNDERFAAGLLPIDWDAAPPGIDDDDKLIP